MGICFCLPNRAIASKLEKVRAAIIGTGPWKLHFALPVVAMNLGSHPVSWKITGWGKGMENSSEQVKEGLT